MPNSDIRRGVVLAVAVLTMASYVFAAPMSRDAPPLANQTIRDFTTGAIGQFLASQNADQQAFNVKGSWSKIDFAGATGSLLTPELVNNAIFQSCDSQNDRSTNSSTRFSQTYKDFVQDLSQAVPSHPASQQMNDTSQQVTATCFDTLPTVRTKALKIFNQISAVPTTNASDPTFLSWASTGFPEFMLAFQACQQAQIAFLAATDSNNGDDAGVFTAARLHVEPLVDDSTSSPGINMPIQPPSPTGPVEGSFVAFYDIPTLNTTLTAWQSGNGLAPFTFSSSTFDTSSNSSTKFGGAHLGITYEEFTGSANAEHSEAQSSANVNALSFDLSFQGLALLDVEQGLWFDDYRVAHASELPDAQHGPAKAIFSEPKYFGSFDSPGPLAVYNAQALVAFQPSWTIQLADSHNSSSSDSTSAGFDISVLGLFELGGYGGSTSNNTHFDSATNTLTINDDSNNGYIIGYVQNGYFNYS